MKLAYLKSLWKKFNEQYFDGRLTEVPIRLTRSKHYYGYFSYTTNSGNESIRISGCMNKTPEDLSDTLRHEMIHQFLYEQTGDCDSAHGERFKIVANDVGVDLKNYEIITEPPS